MRTEAAPQTMLQCGIVQYSVRFSSFIVHKQIVSVFKASIEVFLFNNNEQRNASCLIFFRFAQIQYIIYIEYNTQ